MSHRRYMMIEKLDDTIPYTHIPSQVHSIDGSYETRVNPEDVRAIKSKINEIIDVIEQIQFPLNKFPVNKK